MTVADLSPAEHALWTGFPRGIEVDLRAKDLSQNDPQAGRGWGEERAVRGEVIASLAVGENPGEPGHVPMVRLRGARIAGEFTLAFADVRTALILEECWFEASPDLYWASVAFTSLRGSVMPGLRGGNLRVRGHLRLNGCRFSGEVKLLGAQVAGALLLDGAHVRNRGGVALHGDRIDVAGDISLRERFEAEGEMRLLSARVGGSLAMAGARLSAPRGVALAADNIQVGGGVDASRAQLAGEFSLRRAGIRGTVQMTAARLSNPGRVALRGSRLVADDGLLLDEGFTADGEVRLSNARVGRNIVLAGASLHADSRPALAADGAIIEGSIRAQRLHARGSIDLADARVAGSIHLQAAQLTNPDGRALSANGVRVDAVMDLCDGFTARGTISLTSACIASQLCFDDGALLTPGGQALRCWRVTVPELVLRPREPIEGGVSLQHSSIAILHDDPATWPDEVQLDGLSYEGLHPLLPAAGRLAWLARDPSGHLPGPYEQLAAVYRSLGNDKDARTVLLAKQRQRRQALAWYAQVWGYIQDITVGYGYRPARAALWLLALLALGTTVFTIHHPPPLSNAPVPEFNPFFYTLNLLLPVIDFGQAHAFNPHGFEQWLGYTLTAAGWILATTAAAGIIRALRPD